MTSDHDDFFSRLIFIWGTFLDLIFFALPRSHFQPLCAFFILADSIVIKNAKASKNKGIIQ